DFDFSDRQRAFREKIKGLFDPDSRSALAKLENADDNQIRNVLLHWLKNLGQADYLTLGLDDGRNYVGLVAAQESLAAISPSLFLSVEASTRIFGRLIAIYGTLDQKNELLPALKEGQIIGTVALSEEGMSIENNPLNTTVVPVYDSFQVSGSKSYVVNGPIADWIAVAGKREESLAFFLIKKDSEGLSVGKRLPSLGYNGTAISTISLENCPVPSKCVIGPFEGRGPLKIVRSWENQILTAGSLGLMQRCYETALTYAKNHKSGGKPIIAYQEVGFKLAEMLTLLQTAQLLAYRAAWMAESGDSEASVVAYCAKVFCTESTETVASQALQILGGYGYLGGNPAEEGYRDAKYLQIAGTSSEISRMKIGDGVLERD
ncbi:MAG: acyl-CoA dehydrogenase family protein, partial [Proteobacteria bacterium]|nr:acyl-CoA dehydrogenase family protein [Pseudomonadota bacterium]